jgi:type IV secretion system protein VirD4
VLLAAPTRSWKGVAIVVPNLLTWPDSACVLDIKRENFRLTAGYRARHQPVYAWAPFAEDARGHRWNPLRSVRDDSRFVVGDLLRVAHVLYPHSPLSNSTENFFNGQARNLFLGLSLLLVETPELPRTLGEVLRQGSGKGGSPEEHLRATISERQACGFPLSKRCEEALMRFLNSSDQTRGGILSTFNEPLTVFTDSLVDAATSESDFAIEDVRRERMTVYLCIPPSRLEDAAVLLNLFFSQLIGLNMDTLPEEDPTLKYQCLLCLDEAAAAGRIGILAKAIGYLAGYGLRVLTVCQAGSQIRSVYGDKDADSFITNHAAQILFAPRVQRDANEYSEMLGTFTERSESKGRSHSHGGRGGGSSTSSNVSPQRRALMLPQEIKEMGVTREIVSIENTKPILADKICYYTDLVFRERLLPPPELPLMEISRPDRVGFAAEQSQEECMAFEHAVIDFDLLPDLGPDASEAELARFVDAFFDQLWIEELAPPARSSDQPLNVMEPVA